jgi:hypothetical protein
MTLKAKIGTVAALGPPAVARPEAIPGLEQHPRKGQGPARRPIPAAIVADSQHPSLEHGSSTQPIQVTYTFTNARAFFGPGANPPAAGDLVKIIGSRRHHRQSSGSGTGTSTGSGTSTSILTVRAILIAAPPSSSSASSTASSS